MSLGLFLRLSLRELRGARGRLFFFMLCVALGVSAIVSVAALVESVEFGIRARSRQLLGGDLSLEARTPLPDVRELLPRDLAGRSPQEVELFILPSMARSPAGASHLVDIKAVDLQRAAYPLVGALELSPARDLAALLSDEHSAVVAPEVLETFQLKVGDTLYLGGQPFSIRGVVRREPDPLTFSFSFGPRVLITADGLRRTGLLGFGNRVRYRKLLAFPSGISERELTALKDTLERSFPGDSSFVRIETHGEAQPALRKTLARAESYLGLLSLLSLLLGSVGVAQIMAAWIAQAAPETAVLRCLGLRPREVVRLYVAQTVLLSLLASAVGGALGALLPRLASRRYPELLPPEFAAHVPVFALLRGLVLGVCVTVLFSLPALLAAARVSPARVLRSEAEPLPAPRVTRALSLVAAGCAVFAAAYAQTGRLSFAALFMLGLGLLVALSSACARALLYLVARLPRRRSPSLLWQGATALRRPSAGTRFGIVALSLGTLVIATITLLQDQLASSIHAALPEDAPSVFLADVQPDQWEGVARASRAAGASRVQSVPVVMGRLAALDGRSVKELLAGRPGDRNERDRAHWVLTREQRITFGARLPPSNRLTEGRLWSDPDALEVSLEAGFARDLGARLGSVVRFDIQGVPMDFRVTSLRDVEWRSFDPNFFIFAEPGALDDAPQIRLGAVRLPEAQEAALQNELARRFPNVTVLRVRPLLDKVLAVLDQLALAVRLLGAFAALTGLVMLVGSIAAGQLKRSREVALLKALGVRRARIVAVLSVEYALSGLLSGVLGAGAAYALSLFVSRSLLQLHGLPAPSIALSALLATALISMLGGLLASLRALAVSPLAVLGRSS